MPIVILTLMPLACPVPRKSPPEYRLPKLSQIVSLQVVARWSTIFIQNCIYDTFCVLLAVILCRPFPFLEER